jgi:hypothetical protein
MPERALFERAERAIAESKRLVDQLHKVMWQAQRLNRNLQDLHWHRLEDEAKWARAIHTTATPCSPRTKHDDHATNLPIAASVDC